MVSRISEAEVWKLCTLEDDSDSRVLLSICFSSILPTHSHHSQKLKECKQRTIVVYLASFKRICPRFVLTGVLFLRPRSQRREEHARTDVALFPCIGSKYFGLSPKVSCQPN